MQCDASLLWTLVEQNHEPAYDSDAIAKHLESCARCRRRLAELGGDDAWWNDARQWLSPEDDLSGASDRCADLDLPPLPAVDLGFLEPPSHPEMLGRIGRYDVEGLLGRGGMGVVLRAYDSELRRSVAVKVLAPEWAASMPARRRFAREAQAAASVAHENVIPIYNVESDASLPFLVMRYVPGMTLERWVKTNGPLDAATILRVTGQLAEGLAAAHRRGLVHRDIKPGNVLVGENIDRVWITDFGLARAADSVTLTRTGVIAGTPHYMSPEQARGTAVDHRSDLFSLGCVLYFLSTGVPPFDADNTLAVLHKIVSQRAKPLTLQRNDLPPSFVALVDRLLRRSHDKRPVDCEAVIKQTAAAQRELQAGHCAKPPLVPRHRRNLIGGTVCGAAALLLGAILFQSRPQHDQASSRSSHEVAAITENPWSDDYAAASEVSPYIAQASQQIDISATLDNEQFRRRVNELVQQVERLRRPPELTTFAIPDLEKSQWQRDVAEIETMIRQASQWPHH